MVDAPQLSVFLHGIFEAKNRLMPHLFVKLTNQSLMFAGEFDITSLVNLGYREVGTQHNCEKGRSLAKICKNLKPQEKVYNLTTAWGAYRLYFKDKLAILVVTVTDCNSTDSTPPPNEHMIIKIIYDPILKKIVKLSSEIIAKSKQVESKVQLYKSIGDIGGIWITIQPNINFRGCIYVCKIPRLSSLRFLWTLMNRRKPFGFVRAKGVTQSLSIQDSFSFTAPSWYGGASNKQSGSIIERLCLGSTVGVSRQDSFSFTAPSWYGGASNKQSGSISGQLRLVSNMVGMSRQAIYDLKNISDLCHAKIIDLWNNTLNFMADRWGCFRLTNHLAKINP